MTHTYNITGMTCTGCRAKVQSLLSQVNHIQKVDISLAEGTADITMNRHVATADLQEALAAYPKYQITDTAPHHPDTLAIVDNTGNKTWLQTYKPILLIFGYITVVAFIAGYHAKSFDIMTAMRIFMSGFFLVFSFFKLLDVEGFADSYAMYDVVARKWHGWGRLYVFIELGLGLAFAFNFTPYIVNIVTIVIMSISLIGVLKSVVSKQQIRCACLGAVFNLPMSTVTIIEDGLMIAMGVTMLLIL
ncbi:heavy-metal-associated domain-containing protein [Mucilaginibacter ginsenosidivorax]|uniref:Heavy-metal-associated domain-containing protein n=1 Tax=Mucilaginibacter ginsenosidivorax TaxID=862126 RepID=A0A5B8W1K8_9SPHI|nr:heavy metal-associated domain-containing protein [Mucilaginibacter ginsenosidivorax]QEC76815.1 heavy-metal-associated domain-containing protein [Mucilaginibacter ginsenosidivorax]